MVIGQYWHASPETIDATLVPDISLAGALLVGKFSGVAYFQMKLPDPDSDGYFKAQRNSLKKLAWKVVPEFNVRKLCVHALF